MITPAERLKGIGEYWFSKKLEEVRQMAVKGIDVINLGIGSPDLAPSSETIEAAEKALHNAKLHGYAPYRSLPELREALAQWYDTLYHVRLDPAREILPLLGSKEGILYTSLAFVNPGDKILVPNPGYPAYTSVARIVGAEVAHYDLTKANDWLPDFKSLQSLDLARCKLMWVNYPHMPTGRKADARTFEQLIAFGRAKGILIAHDNPYGLVLNDEPPLSILATAGAKDVCLELNSFSKAFNMSGWRVGMVAAQRSVIDAILQVKSNVDSGMFAPIQFGAMAALHNSSAWHNERNQIYRRRRDIVFRLFDELGFSYDTKQVGLFVWAQAPRDINDVPAFVDLLLQEAHVFLTPGFIFGTNGQNYARSSLCASEERLRLALERVTSWKRARR